MSKILIFGFDTHLIQNIARFPYPIQYYVLMFSRLCAMQDKVLYFAIPLSDLDIV